jgi:hypothetical protein
MDRSITTFPRQKVSYREKLTSKWQEECVDGVIAICNSYGSTRRSTRKNKLRNYNLLNNKIDERQFSHVLNPFGLQGEFLEKFKLPASIQPYDVVSPFFMLLFGEESKRPFDPIVMATNKDAVHSKLDQKKSMIMELLGQYLMPEQQEGAEPPPTPEQILNASNMSIKDMKERQAQHLLNYYMQKLNLPDIFQAGWKDSLVGGEEVYRIDKIAGYPKVTRVNTLEIEYVLPNNSDNIDQADKIYEKNRMTIPEIIDEFYEILTEKQIEKLELMQSGNTMEYENYFEGPPVSIYSAPLSLPYVDSIDSFSEPNHEQGIDVHRVRWKSFKKVGILHTIDPSTQEEFQEPVDEFYRIPNTPDRWVEWFWINEYWEGIRIGEDMYINVRPRSNQFRSVDNLSKCSSGYVGTVYNALNSQSVSLMDRLYPWICLYLIVWFRTEMLLAANMDKIALIDTSLIPDGWEPQKWLYYAQSMKIGFVNSFNEGNKGVRIGQQNQSTQNKELDLSTGQSIQFYITLLSYIEERMGQTTGVTAQRMGAISTHELVGNTERSVIQSSHITEEWFRVHNNTKIRVCEALLEIAKDCLESGKEIYQYVTDDIDTFLFAVDPDEFTLADYGIFVGNGAKYAEALQTLKAMMQTAIQSDRIGMGEVVDIINSNSLSSLASKLKNAEQARMQQAQQAQMQGVEIQKQALEQKERELQLKRYEIDSNNETKLQVAAINSYIGQENLDQDGDGQPDPVELAGLSLKAQELASKENIEKLKIKQTEVQNRSQERIADKQLSLKEKEIKSKEKIARMKPKGSSSKK